MKISLQLQNLEWYWNDAYRMQRNSEHRSCNLWRHIKFSGLLIWLLYFDETDHPNHAKKCV